MLLVTGGAGFIGSNIVAALSEKYPGRVVVCDRLRKGDKWRNIAKHEIADLVPPEKLLSYLDTPGTRVASVIHMGAISSTTETDADLIMENNFRLSMSLWRWCSSHGVPFLYASSAATYGDGAHGFNDEFSIAALEKLRPLNAYGYSKHLFDRRVARMVERHELLPPQWVGLKFFNVYGPNEYHKGSMQSVVSHAFRQIKADGKVKLFKSHHPDYEDGGQLRDFVYVKDVVAVIDYLLHKPEVSGLFNLGSGKARSFKDLVTATFQALDLQPNIEFIDTPIEIRDKYQYYTEARMNKLTSAGYNQPMYSLEDGVTDYVQNYLNQSDRFR